jgi:nitrogen fixation protein FixH
MSDPTNSAPGRLTGRGVLIGFVAFFTVVVGFDVTFSTIAYKTFSGEVAADPYEAGILFNQTLAKRRAEAGLGWMASLESEVPGEIRLRLHGRDGRALDGLRVTGAVIRPATEAGQRALVFTGLGDGVYRAKTSGLHGGWDVNLTATSAGGSSIDIAKRVLLP